MRVDLHFYKFKVALWPSVDADGGRGTLEGAKEDHVDGDRRTFDSEDSVQQRCKRVSIIYKQDTPLKEEKNVIRMAARRKKQKEGRDSHPKS